MKLIKDEEKFSLPLFCLGVAGSLVLLTGVTLLILALSQRFTQRNEEHKIRKLAGGFSTEAPQATSGPMQYVKKNHQDRSYLSKEVQTAAGIVNVTWEDPSKRNIDFDALKNVNSDIKAWIYVPNTQIDYPVLAATEDEGENFYLKRNYNKRTSSHGSIFIQTGEDDTFGSFNTILYGHNMKDGSMFQSVYELKDKYSAASRSMLYIYTPDGISKAQLLACYETDNSNLAEQFNHFEQDTDKSAYVNSFQNTTDLYNDYKDRLVKEGLKTITLSTCTNEGKGRLVAQYVIL